MERRRLGNLITCGSLGAALCFWVINAAVMGPRLAAEGGAASFFRNVAIGVTFMAGLPAAGAAYTLVAARTAVAGSGALQGIGRRTVIAPLALSTGAVVLGVIVSALAARRFMEAEWVKIALVLAVRFVPVGAAFAFMGSLAGNLAGSVTLEARDLGRWRRINLVLVASHSAFWVLLMGAVLQLLWRQTGALAP